MKTILFHIFDRVMTWLFKCPPRESRHGHTTCKFVALLSLAALTASAQSNTVTISGHYPAALVTVGDQSLVLLNETNLLGPLTSVTNAPIATFTNQIVGTDMPFAFHVTLSNPAPALFWVVQSTSLFWQQTNTSNIASNPPSPPGLVIGITHP